MSASGSGTGEDATQQRGMWYDGGWCFEQEPIFEHSSLPNPSEYIRLLTIGPQSAAQDGAVQYSLSSWRFGDAPAYHAISYTWGPADEDEFIQLDGKVKRIRRNCADVLRQVCHFRTSRYLWIDTLCIDQGNVKEKSRQVAMMGSIFHKAECVLVCIGSSQHENHAAIRLLCEYDTYHTHHNLFKLTTRNTAEDDIERARRFASWAKSHPIREVFHLWRLCRRLADRDYFERVWTTPEFLLARDARIYLGSFCLKWQAFFDVLYLLEFQVDGAMGSLHVRDRSCFIDTVVVRFADLDSEDISQKPTPSRESDGLNRTLKLFDQKICMPFGIRKHYTHGRFMRAVTGIGGQRSGYDQTNLVYALLSLTHRAIERLCRNILRSPRIPVQSTPVISLQDIVHLSSHKHCSDPRDTIYALWPLLEPDDAIFIQPDYDASVFELAIAILGRLKLYDDSTWDLFRNLRLHRGTFEVEHALMQRTMLLSDKRMLENPASCAKDHLWHFASSGIRLDEGSEIQLGETVGGLPLKRVISNVTSRDLGLVCANANRGDWVLHAWGGNLTYYMLTRLEIVLRPVGNRFAIVGLAQVNHESPHYLNVNLEGSSGFEVYFDPYDYVVYLASMFFQPTTHEDALESLSLSSTAVRLNMGVCRAPFSSYAERVATT